MSHHTRVLFVDDEAYFSRRYRDALREEFFVVYCESTDEASYQLKAACELSEAFDALVLDVMMPPESADSAETGDGFETGLWLLNGAERVLPGGVPPTVLLSNRSVDLVREGLRRRKLDPDDPRFDLRLKEKTSAEELPKIVRDLLARQQR